jgi:predicted short-subunit dehydrogenase-like oxidoreductase (DUF2520 family)
MNGKALPSVTLVGPGRAGKAFGRSWIAAGGHLAEVIGRTSERARAGVEALGEGTPRGLAQARCEGEILAIAVPDDAVGPVAGALADRFRGRLAFHVSGALAAAVLGPLKSSGAKVASLHPARVFTGAPGDSWTGAFVAVEGEPEAVAEAERIASAVRAIPCTVSTTAKPLYHAAAALAAGGTAALISLATRVWQEAGIPARQARPALAELAGQAADAAGQDLEGAFTGPISRRDLGTIEANAKALASHPELLDLYAILASEILQRTPGRGRENEIRALLAARRADRSGKT